MSGFTDGDAGEVPGAGGYTNAAMTLIVCTLDSCRPSTTGSMG